MNLWDTVERVDQSTGLRDNKAEYGHSPAEKQDVQDLPVNIGLQQIEFQVRSDSVGDTPRYNRLKPDGILGLS